MIIEYHKLSNIRKYIDEETIALTFGSFDVVHEGHVRQLEFATEQADLLVVGVMPDEYILRKKGPGRPVHNQYDRIQNIDASEFVSYSFVTPPTAIARAILRLRPDVYVEHIEKEEERGHQLRSLFLGALAVKHV